MEVVDYCNHFLKNEKSQSTLKMYVQMLLKGCLKNKNEYAQEKAIKCFCEGISYLEGLMLMQRNIHPKNWNITELTMNNEEYLKKYEEVERIIDTEIKRQYRHFEIFLR